MSSSYGEKVHRLGADPAQVAEELGSDDQEMRSRALGELIQRGKPAVPALLAALHSPDDAVRALAAEGLASIADPSTAGDLANALKDKSGAVRSQAASGLANMGDQRGMPALVDTINDFSDILHADLSLSAYALARQGEKALPFVVPLLKSEDEATRWKAIWVIQQIVSGMTIKEGTWDKLNKSLGNYDPAGPADARNSSGDKWAEWVQRNTGGLAAK